ncbi:hypothetical protein [Clostridium sp. Marseille-P2415]|uniref:hypothetical protein n=1 Tax=Clostridium sp. Marseille-P2415 TaxID=1805471 RepID=UPI0009884BED|nr:hypothetical protein [Clostridium sp. Marseille-P2415]
MFRKKISYICFAVAAAVLFAAGCGRKEAADSGGTPSEVTESETAAIRMEKAITEGSTEEETAGSEEDMGQAGPGTESMDSSESAGPGKKVEAFAERIQEAVADRDMEAFADLLLYPCVFVTGDQETIILKQRDDLMKQNPDMVFGDDLMIAVANVDTVTLKMTEEGVILGEGASNITFKEKSDGSIGITEIRE